MNPSSPTWQQVAHLAVQGVFVLILVSAVIAAYILAPPSVGVVTSIVSTIVGSLFVNFRGPPAPALTGDKPEGGQ